MSNVLDFPCKRNLPVKMTEAAKPTCPLTKEELRECVDAACTNKVTVDVKAAIEKYIEIVSRR